jgi:hypothetical protein
MLFLSGEVTIEEDVEGLDVELKAPVADTALNPEPSDRAFELEAALGLEVDD